MDINNAFHWIWGGFWVTLLAAVLWGAVKDENKVQNLSQQESTINEIDVGLVQEFKLSDGTECVAIANNNSVTCNWKQNEQ